MSGTTRISHVIGARLAVCACVVMGVLALQVPPALALSGYATDQPAVDAQYPDAGAGGFPLRRTGPAASLRPLISVRPAVVGDSRRARRTRATQRDIQQAAVRAVSAAAVLGPTQSGSIALLLGATGFCRSGVS